MRGLYVVSTCSTPIRFVEYHEHSLAKGQIPQMKGPGVIIKGGANLMNKHLFTPAGVATAITEDQLAFLTANAKFMQAVADGYMSVIGDDGDTERAAKSMRPKDGTAPKTEADFARRDDMSGLKTGQARAA